MSEPLWAELQRLFHAWTGNRLRMQMHRSAMEEIERRARRHHLKPETYLATLERGDLVSERDGVIERLVNRTTWFLRDAKGIHALVEQMQQRTRTEARVWVAGCSTGQEPYTLVMALLDAGITPRVLATDISREALQVAEEGTYRAHELNRVPEIWKRRYFTAIDRDRWRVTTQVRDCITFRYNNLAAPLPAPAAGWDAVVCRNVLLHFERQHAAAVVRSLNASTAYLLLSPVEQPLAWITQARRIDIDEVVLLRGDRMPPTPVTEPGRLPRARTEPPVVIKRAATDYVSDLVGRACHELAAGSLDAAIELCDVALAGDRLVSAAHLAKGLALNRAGRFAEAVPVLRNARFLSHDEAWLAPYTLARCLDRIGEREGAVEAYRHALEIVEAGGAAGLSPWDPGMDALAHTIGETCRARLRTLSPL
jgi:chemotaxis methyl-accepting protein methylase